MWPNLFLYKYSILKQVNGSNIIHCKDLDMGVGFTKEIYLSMGVSSCQVQHYLQILFLKSICHFFLKIIMGYMAKLQISIPLYLL